MTRAGRRFRALIVDDEALARKRLAALLAGEPDVEVVGEAATGPRAVELIRSLRPDLLLLDVQMPGLDGFDVLRAVPDDHLPAVIFVTAHDEHAIRAFEVQAVDYLLKPVVEARFRAAIRRAIERARGLPSAALAQQILDVLDRVRPSGASDRIALRDGGRVTFVPTREIEWIEAVGDYVNLHVGRQVHLLRETMNGLERRLPADRFIRIHRSRIVQIDRIRAIEPWRKGDYMVVLHDGTRLAAGRTYRERLQALLS